MPTSDDGSFYFAKDEIDPALEDMRISDRAISEASTRVGLGLICAGAAITGGQIISVPGAVTIAYVALTISVLAGGWFIASAVRAGTAARELY